LRYANRKDSAAQSLQHIALKLKQCVAGCVTTFKQLVLEAFLDAACNKVRDSKDRNARNSNHGKQEWSDNSCPNTGIENPDKLTYKSHSAPHSAEKMI
jgi:hypothetical protein